MTVQQQELTYPVLSDVEYRVVRQYTPIVHPPDAERSAHLRQFYADDSWELPAPGAFVLAEDGVLTMAVVEAEYTRRLEPSRWFKPAPGLFNQCQSKGLKLVYNYLDKRKASWPTMIRPSCCARLWTKVQRSASKRICASVDFA